MAKDEFEVIETKLAELYQFQWERIKSKMATNIAMQTREEVTEARKILDLWMCCIEAKGRANRRFEAKGRLDE